ncbi:hypothetical protein CY0110_25051 [Crocosphaera chwakensis CCY0110]|uniref:Uncharacterized protein n=2 Tax=Crocosphaera TaxID=263510 RepID=A3IMY6_9CHRO|nr:hypothetical protein CY0110_25051 [Crocosphaera chwakensis CCY0110]
MENILNKLMMNKLLRKTWNEFQYMISQIEDQATPQQIFESFQNWYKKNKKNFSPSLLKIYRIEELINIDPKKYPLAHSQCTPQTLRRFLHLELSHEDSFVMFLRDQLWELVVLTIDAECHRCGTLEMSALFDVEAQQVVLECLQCGELQTLKGNSCKCLNPKILRLAQKKYLEIFGLI